MPDPALSGSEFKKQLRAGQPEMGLFLNAHSPTVAEQLVHSGERQELQAPRHSAVLETNARVAPPLSRIVRQGGDFEFM